MPLGLAGQERFPGIAAVTIAAVAVIEVQYDCSNKQASSDITASQVRAD
jgi:hypothetical protein